jgi:hypothetical protein
MHHAIAPFVLLPLQRDSPPLPGGTTHHTRTTMGDMPHIAHRRRHTTQHHTTQHNTTQRSSHRLIGDDAQLSSAEATCDQLLCKVPRCVPATHTHKLEALCCRH